MGRNMANPFKWEHLLYGLAGLAIGLLGYYIGFPGKPRAGEKYGQPV